MPPFDLLSEREKGDGGNSFCVRCEPNDQTFCAGLPVEETRQLMAILSQTQCDAHATIFREGDPAQFIYSVGSGAIKLYKLLPDGRRQITAFLFRGNFFGIALHDCYAYTAEAMTAVNLCRFPRRKL